MSGSAAAPCLAMIDLNMQLLRLLAVAGGAALGYLLIGGMLRFVGRFVFREKLPQFIHVGLRLLGGLTGALLVLWLYGLGGGGGWGSGGGGWFPFGGSGSGADGPQPTNVARKTPETTPSPRGEALQVELLGGAKVKDQRFYRLEGSDQAQNFVEVTRDITLRREQAPNVTVLRLVLRKESVDRDSQAVKQLDKWARDNGLTPELATP